MSLLARFQSDSKFDSSGQFTIDESKARQKMARFQLSSSTEFLMLAVQAAVASHCQKIIIIQEEHKLRLTAPGVDLDPEAVRDHEAFLFEDTVEALPYHLLGVAANAVEPHCLQPPLVAVSDGELCFEVELKLPIGNLKSAILERLAFLPCPLTLDLDSYEARPIPDGSTVELDFGETSSIRLIRHGVQVYLESSKRNINYRAVAVANELSLDASFSQIVKNKAFHQLIRTLDDKANQALADFASHHASHDIHGYLLAQLGKKHPNPAGSSLENCPLFPAADRAGMLSLKEISELVSRQGKVLVAKRRYNLQMETPVVLIDNPIVVRALNQSIGSKSQQGAEGKIEAQLLIAARKKTWEESPRPVELPPGDFHCRSTVQGEGWEAALGFLIDGKSPSRVEILFQGRSLCSEPLSNVPPGATAVVNVLEGDVNAEWLALEKRRNQQVHKELRSAIMKLWRSQTEIDPRALGPELKTYLLDDLKSQRPTNLAKSTPLFPRLDAQPPENFLELSHLLRVRMGRPYLPSELDVSRLGSEPIYLFSEERYEALRSKLGQSVVDLRGFQARLEKLQKEWDNPEKPKLSNADLISRFPFSLRDSQGEVGLLKTGRNQLSLRLLHRGACLEELTLSATKHVPSQAIIEAPHLTLLDDLTGFVKNQEYSDLIKAITEKAKEVERKAVFFGELSAELRLAILDRYTYTFEEISGIRLFPNSTYDKFANLTELAAELQRHGGLLFGSMWGNLPGRHIIPSDNTLARKQITTYLPEVTWADAQMLIDQQQRIFEFNELPVVSEIALPGSYTLRLVFAEGRGEVALRRESTSRRGDLHAYVEGRKVCTKKEILPPDFDAALEHPDLILASSYNDVVVPTHVHQLLRQTCDELMVQAAAQASEKLETLPRSTKKQKAALEPFETLRHRAWQYFATTVPTEEAKQAFLNQLKVPVFDGTLRTFESLSTAKIQGYVQREFRNDIECFGTVLRITTREAELLYPFLGKRLSLLENSLISEAYRQAALRELPQALPADIFKLSYEDSNLKATLGVCRDFPLVGFSSEGEPIGVIRPLQLPVGGFIFGANRGDEKKPEQPRAILPRTQHQLFESWAESLCLEWVEDLEGSVLDQEGRALALTMLRGTLRHLASTSTSRVSQIATRLWDLPLFRRVDQTLVSGAALAATLAETKQPLQVASRRFRAPDDALHLPADSPELSVLTDVFGKAALRDYEAPPLLQFDEIARTTKSLISWGLAPVRAGFKAVGRASDLVADLGQRLRDSSPAQEAQETTQKQQNPQEKLLISLREDVRSLLGRRHFQESDQLFQNLDFGMWPLGPPIYRPRKTDHFRLNALNSNVRWLLSGEGSRSEQRTVRMLLVIHWVGLVNVDSEQLADSHEDEFLNHLAERMAQTFSNTSAPSTPVETPNIEKREPKKKIRKTFKSKAPEGLFP